MPREDWLPTMWGGRSGDPLQALRRQIDDIFNDLGPFRGSAGGLFAQGFRPHMDVAETDAAMTVTAELPGLSRENVEVTLSGGLLTIRGEKTHELSTADKPDATEVSADASPAAVAGQEGENRPVYHRVERAWGAFERSIRLPFEVETDKVTADFRDGVLTVTLPKAGGSRGGAHKIEIRSAR